MTGRAASPTGRRPGAGLGAGSGEETPAQRTRFGLILLLWAAGLGAAGQYGKVALVYEMLPGLYPGQGAALGWAVSLVGLVGILLGVAAGATVSAIGLRRAMLI
ncbi:MAG: hypothetical protein V2I65_19285, partial [Paracoccaceae bacterium]|nr:hypothetical protein [Paracoccaceae bacterium]